MLGRTRLLSHGEGLTCVSKNNYTSPRGNTCDVHAGSSEKVVGVLCQKEAGSCQASLLKTQLCSSSQIVRSFSVCFLD